ncbi:HD-GYP domain-containing protein [Niallia sp. Krafla_26]|uniref:HD-GYP domain-containing protein n=1 Tax=Niallia sp. Krafla_26 TaxID=3064703 RepID=UPI003D180495
MAQVDLTYINQLKKGDTIANDIYFNDILLVKKGTIVNNSLLRNLESWGIANLHTKHDKRTVKHKEKIFYSKELFDLKELFYESLQYVVSEARYGLILNSDAQLAWIEHLFISSLLDARISASLFSLKKKDPYSYFHSFDVFLLGALLARDSGIKDIKSFAIGCLIYDIGKLKINKELLQKDGTLSKTEYEEIQKHTLYGLDVLKEINLPSKYEELVKSHHERLDGTGYPEGVTGESLSEEVRLLAVVDTYSALTLQRPYRRTPFSSLKAIELLLSKENKYDIKYVINLMELINIYPKGSLVKLSNGKRARVKEVNENQPYFPILEDIDSSEVFELPLNLSTSIVRFLEWSHIVDVKPDEDISKKEIYWNYFITEFINGNVDEAMTYFPMITEGMLSNNIFIDVIIRLIKEVETKRIEGQLSIGEEHDALLNVKDILKHVI